MSRLAKVMQDAGIKLTSVASALLTKSGRARLEGLLAGQSDPKHLAELARDGCAARFNECARCDRTFYQPPGMGPSMLGGM